MKTITKRVLAIAGVLALGLTAVLAWAAGMSLIFAVCGPLRAMTGLMGKLADGELTVAVPNAERKDEIGMLAKAITIFKEQLAGAERSKAEQTRTIVDSVGAGLSSVPLSSIPMIRPSSAYRGSV